MTYPRNFIKLVVLMISATLVKLLLQVIHVLSWLCYVYWISAQ